MRKSSMGFIVIVAILVIIGIVWYGRGQSDAPSADEQATTTVSIPSSSTTRVSDKFSQYQNSELGFAVTYPSTWEAERVDTGVTFIMPIDRTQVSTVATLRADVNAVSTKCAFPPVTKIKDRATVPVGDNSFNMISMSNTVQGRTYFNRMYSLQKENICYFFSFSSVASSTQKMTGSNLVQAENNNKAIINTTDTAFTEMVKSFTFVSGPQGEDETKAAPTSN